LRFYTTPTAMADLNELREALGYVQIDIFGTSYGTRAAQFFLRQYPAQVRSVILKGVTPISENIPPVIAPDAQNSLEKVFVDCEATSTCQSAYPKLREEFAALLKRFETGPISVNYTSTDHNSEAVKLSRGSLITSIRSLLQSTATIAQLPQLIHESYQEKYTSLIKSVLTIRD